jgi:capsular polysaccharide biosynthesis protein
MRYRLTPRRGAELLDVSHPGLDGATRSLPPLILPGSVELRGPVFAEGPPTMNAHDLDIVRQPSRRVADPGLPLFSAHEATVVGDSFIVLDNKWLLFNRLSGDEMRQPDPNRHKLLVRDARGQTFLDASAATIDRFPGRYVLAYWEPARMYHHWIFECLTRALVASADEALADAKLLLPLDVPGFALDTLRLLGIGEDRLAFFDPDRLCQVEELLMIPFPRYDLEVCGGAVLGRLRNAVLPRLPPSPYAGRNIVFSRKDAMSGERILINEDAVVERLESEGFVAIELTAYSVAEQMSIAHHAAMIVCVHGSAGANLLFASPATKVLHLFPDCVHYFYTHGIGTSIAGAPYAYLYGLSFERKLRYHNNPWLLSANRVLGAVDRLRAM